MFRPARQESTQDTLDDRAQGAMAGAEPIRPDAQQLLEVLFDQTE
jgi:hypothetical protein